MIKKNMGVILENGRTKKKTISIFWSFDNNSIYPSRFNPLENSYHYSNSLYHFLTLGGP